MAYFLKERHNRRMNNNGHGKDISITLKKSLEEVRKQVIETEKKNDGYLVIAGKDGKVKKVPARDL
jgi:hypothetical protein